MTEHEPWLSLPDEDPPERGLAELMAAARMKAEVMANPPWWKRLFAVMRRPPVLALATVVVLVGGVIVVGRHHDEAASPAPSLDVPAGSLDMRARGAVPESPPPPAVEKEREAPRGHAIGGAQQAPELDTKATATGNVNDEQALDTRPTAAEQTKAIDDRAELGNAAPVEKTGIEKAAKAGPKKAETNPADPLARCRAAAARRDCAAAKACVKDLGNVDVGTDAALKSCL